MTWDYYLEIFRKMDNAVVSKNLLLTLIYLENNNFNEINSNGIRLKIFELTVCFFYMIIPEWRSVLLSLGSHRVLLDRYREVKHVSQIKPLRISVITVCYNAAATIEQTILSVLNQTYQDIEFIIVDGNSTDGTIDIVKKYQDKIAHWISEPDTGIYEAMNKGIDLASGDYVYFLGADDSLFDKHAMEKISRHLRETKPEVLCGKIYVVDDVFCTRTQRKTGRPLTVEEVYSGQIAPHQGMFVQAELIRKYRFNELYKIAGDYDLFLRLNKDGCRIQYVNNVVAYYSNGGVGASRNMPRVYECLDSIGSHLPEEYVRKYKQTEGIGERIRIHLDRIVRKILNTLGLIRYYRLYYGWEYHTCDNQQCRWCGRM